MDERPTAGLVRVLICVALLAAVVSGCGDGGSASACASVPGVEITDTCDDQGGGGTLSP